MVEFRRSLAASFLFKGLLWAAQQLEADAPGFASPFPENYRSGGCPPACWCSVLCRHAAPAGAYGLQPYRRAAPSRGQPSGLDTSWTGLVGAIDGLQFPAR